MKTQTAKEDEGDLKIFIYLFLVGEGRESGSQKVERRRKRRVWMERKRKIKESQPMKRERGRVWSLEFGEIEDDPS